MNKVLSALTIAVIATISGPPARGAVVLVDFQQALNSDEIKRALGNDVAFYLSGMTTPTIQKTFKWSAADQQPYAAAVRLKRTVSGCS